MRFKLINQAWWAAAVLAACATSPIITTTEPSPPAAAAPSAVAALTATPSAAPSATPSQTPTATPTPNATLVAEATLEAVRGELTAAGLAEGSAAYEAAFARRRCAVAPPLTPTPLPWSALPVGATAVSADCLGSDLPGIHERLWLDGRWVEAEAFALSAAERLAAQAAYQAYFDLIAAAAEPPGPDFAARLASHMDSARALGSPQSCLAAEVASAVGERWARGAYVRLEAPAGLQWAEEARLLPGAEALYLVLRWQAPGLRQTLVEAASGAVVQAAPLPVLAGTAWLRYDAGAGRWRVFDDAGGYPCGPFQTLAQKGIP